MYTCMLVCKVIFYSKLSPLVKKLLCNEKKIIIKINQHRIFNNAVVIIVKSAQTPFKLGEVALVLANQTPPPPHHPPTHPGKFISQLELT